MSKPKITLITCTHFRPDLLRRAIQSTQQQIFEDYEHLIISDHCPFAEHVYNDFKYDKRIKFLKTPEPYIYNLGARSFNTGIEAANSKYISYLLDDDILYPNHLQEHYNQLVDNKNKWGHSNWDNVRLEDTIYESVKHIVSFSFKELQDMSYDNRNTNNSNIRLDVGALCHRKDILVKWPLQSELTGGWEDSVFMNQLGVNSKSGDYTMVKINWGGIHKKDTKGTDLEYYNILMNKLKKDNSKYGGYELIEQPYVYPKLKDTLYGK
jgi:glycosyltransferase involved in cell wall biosynthesis